MTHRLIITLRSDAAFGRGDGVAGLVDQEIEHDAKTGLPFIRGRTLKGLLVEECANILYGLHGKPGHSQLEQCAEFLFGNPGSLANDDANLRVGAAKLPPKLESAVRYAIEVKKGLTAADILDSLTTIRRQTAVDDASGKPEDGSLRAARVLLRRTRLISTLDFAREPDSNALALLAACASAVRRGGTNRNRGAGRLQIALDSGPAMKSYLDEFCILVTGGAK